MRKEILPNSHLGAKAIISTVVEGENLPNALNRISRDKIRQLMNYANLRKGQTVLEMFAGSNMATAIFAKRLAYPDRLTALDIHYSLDAGWRYVYEENYRRQARLEGVRSKRMPNFLAADAREVPLSDESFDCILTPDSPRMRSNPTWQKDLFLLAGLEARRLLKRDGIYAATCYPSWGEALKYIFSEIEMQDCYVRCRK